MAVEEPTLPVRAGGFVERDGPGMVAREVRERRLSKLQRWGHRRGASESYQVNDTDGGVGWHDRNLGRASEGHHHTGRDVSAVYYQACTEAHQSPSYLSRGEAARPSRRRSAAGGIDIGNAVGDAVLPYW